MKTKQQGITLGSLLRFIAVAALATVVILGYNKWQSNAQVSLIESMLIDAKVRTEDVLTFEDDRNITIGEAAEKAAANAKKIDESITELKKQDSPLTAQHRKKALEVLIAARDLVRAQAKAIINHAGNRAEIARLEPRLAELTAAANTGVIRVEEQSEVTALKMELLALKAQKEAVLLEKTAALKRLIDATKDARAFFDDRALIDVERYER